MRTYADYFVLVVGIVAVCVFYILAVAALHTATHPQPPPPPPPPPPMHRVDTPDCTAPDIEMPDSFIGCPDNYRKGMDNA